MEAVHLAAEAGEIVVRVVCIESTWGCPHCQQRMHIHEWDQRRWRHPDSCQFQTYIDASVPRVRCPQHGTITVQVPWAESYGRFTKLFERWPLTCCASAR